MLARHVVGVRGAMNIIKAAEYLKVNPAVCVYSTSSDGTAIRMRLEGSQGGLFDMTHSALMAIVVIEARRGKKKEARWIRDNLVLDDLLHNKWRIRE